MDEQQALEALEQATDEAEVLALEAELVRQTDNSPRPEDGEQPVTPYVPEHF